MARFDGDLKAAGEAKLDVDELTSALSSTANRATQERQDAIACFLSASEGWKDAKDALKGTFASISKRPWLTDGKD